MTTEIAAIDSDQYAPALPTPNALDSLVRYAEAIEVAYTFAVRVCRTDVVPKIYKGKPHDASVAILHGAELGLNPLQALQNVFPVHGMPSIYAKTMVALLKSKGYKFKTIETGPKKVVVTGWWPGEDPETSEWTIERATQAGFVPTIDPDTGKYKTKKFSGERGSYEKLIGNEKYILQPEDMLWAKAAATVCRRLAPHILLGLGVAEDQEDRADEPAPAEPVRVTSERVNLSDLTDKVAPGTPGGVPVQQWEPPTETAEEGSTPVVNDAPAETPESDSGPAEEPPIEDAAAPLCTPAQQRRLAILLDQHGVKGREDKLAYLGEQFKREFGSSKELTKDEARGLIEFLSRPIEGDDAKAGE